MKTATRTFHYCLTATLALTLASYVFTFNPAGLIQPGTGTVAGEHAVAAAFETSVLSTDEVDIATLGITGRNR